MTPASAIFNSRCSYFSTRTGYVYMRRELIFSVYVVYLYDWGGGTSQPRLAFDRRTNYEVNRRLIDEASLIIIEGCNLYLCDVLVARQCGCSGRRSLATPLYLQVMCVSRVPVDLALSSPRRSASPASHTRDPAARATAPPRRGRTQYFHSA